MKKLNKIFLFSVFCLLWQICFTAHSSSQFTSLPIRLVTSTGTPLTGQAGNIEFTKYPHNYPADVISGITVSEFGTAGNYVARGFNAFQYAKLWLSGVNQLWFDSVLTGNIFSYLMSNFVTLGTTQTITGQKTTTGNWLGTTTGDWIYSGSTSHTLNKPYIFIGSPWLSDYSLFNSNSLLPKIAADSFYLKREFVFYNSGDNKLYFNTTGSINSFRIAKRGGGQLFDINPAHFTWSPVNGLNFNTALLNQDSIAAKNFTSVKDTTWFVLGEPVSRFRYLTLKKPFWFNQTVLPFPDWKWYYRSVDESGITTARDSFMVMNHTDMTIDETPFEVFAVDSWSDADTVTLPVRGTYIVTYDCSLIFPYSDIAGITARDTVMFRVVDGLSADKTGSHAELWRDFNSTVNYSPESNTISRTFFLFNASAGTKYVLQVRADLNTELVNAAVTKPQFTYLLVR